MRLCQWVPANTVPSPLCGTSSSDRTSQLVIHGVPFSASSSPPPLPFASLLGSIGHYSPHDKLSLTNFTQCIGYFSRHHHQILGGNNLKRERSIWLVVGEDHSLLYERGQSIRVADGSAVAEAILLGLMTSHFLGIGSRDGRGNQSRIETSKSDP